MSITEGTILRIVVQCLWSDGNIIQNVFNAVPTGGSPPYDEDDIVDDALDWADTMYANITPTISDELDGNNVTVYEYDPVDDDWDEVGSASFTWNPSNVAEQVPRGVAGMARAWTTDPDVQGKKYIAGLCETNILDGMISSGSLSDMLDFATDWVGPFVGIASGGTWTPGVWSVVGKVFKAMVDHYAVTGIPAYQRRRKRNVGI